MHSFGIQPTHEAVSTTNGLTQPRLIHRAERVQSALGQMGVSVLLGGFTTFVGVLPCSFAGSEVFRVFFHMFFDIIVFGLLHGLVLVPILLCVFGAAVDRAEAAWVWQHWREICKKEEKGGSAVAATGVVEKTAEPIVRAE